MVEAAERNEVAGTCLSTVRVRDDVVDVALGRRPLAARSPARAVLVGDLADETVSGPVALLPGPCSGGRLSCPARAVAGRRLPSDHDAGGAAEFGQVAG